MKHRHIFLTVAAAILALGSLASCRKDEPKEITELDLSRCLQPTNLSARVVSTKGDVIIFNWDEGKDTKTYLLYLYSDEEMTQEYNHYSLTPDDLPYIKQVEVDKSYWFKVRATNDSKEPSKWAFYEKEIKTYAVKDALYPEVTGRTSTSISLEWSKEVEDYKDVTCISYNVTGSGDVVDVPLTDEQKEAAAATVTDLAPSTEYDIKLMSNSATRGDLVVWTTPDVSGTTEVNSVEGLKNALKTSGAKILLKMEGSPYEIGECDISNGFSIYGEETVDGAKPVIKGELYFADNWVSGESAYFEGVEFDGNGSKAYGLPIQKKKSSSTSSTVTVGSIIFKNCIITNYSKGLVYDNQQPMQVGELTWQDCIISNVNPDGTGSGDVVDIRGTTSSIGELNILNNTIYQGMRTLLRFDVGPTLGDLRIENNTLQNLCFVDNSNNRGIFGLRVIPSSVTFKKNLFLNFVEKSVLGSTSTSNKTAEEIGLKGSDNWFYNVYDGFFTTTYPASKAGYNKLDTDPCYNAKGGVFNILASSDIAGQEIGASRWWAPYSEKPEDLTLNCLEGPVVWNFADASVFDKTDIKKEMVRGDLYISGSEECQFKIVDGVMKFVSATACSKKGFPEDGFLKFIVDKSGSVVIRTTEGGAANVTVGTSTTDGVIKIVGGAATMSGTTTPTKIVIPDIEEETTVYVYASGAIGIDQLAWSEDVSKINTALASPVTTIDPAYMTAGESTDITVTWEAVPSAGGYVAEFQGKQYTIEEGALTYTVEGKMTSMLDKGSYTVNVYATPLPTDIYNTVSEAGSASFAVLPSGGGGETELVVKTVDELKAAIAAGKTAITLDAVEFDLSADTEWSGTMPITASLALKGKDGAKVKGTVSISGQFDDLSLDNINFVDSGTGSFFINMPADPVVKLGCLSITRCSFDSYKSIIYGNGPSSVIDKVTVLGNTITNIKQGVFDLRKGTFAQTGIVGNTVIGGVREFIRFDSACTASSLDISNNTIDGNCLAYSNGMLYVRAALTKYTVNRNLFLNEVKTGGNTLLSKDDDNVKVPSNMSCNYYYNIDGTSFFTGEIDSLTATFKGAILSASPVKDLTNHDYTLTNGVLIADKVGAPKWQPSVAYCDLEKITVNNSDEFKAALDAGKVEIILAAAGSPYTFGTMEESTFTIPANFHLVGESGSLPEFYGRFNLDGTADLGTVIFDNIKFCNTSELGLGCAVTVKSTTTTLRNFTMKNCTVDGFAKSVYYDNVGATVGALVFNNVTVQNHGTSQSVFDVRKGNCSSITIQNCTVTGGRELVQFGAGTITDCLTITNNTVYGSNLGVNSNAILFVKATPSVYKFTNNLFLGEKKDGKTVILGKASGVTVPTAAGKNFVWEYDEANFFTAPFTQEATGFSTLSYCPVKDAANGDYTLTDALLLSSNIGALKWNPNRGRVTSEITVTNLEEFINALSAGKTDISVKADTLNFKGAPVEATSFSGGFLLLSSSLSLTGIRTLGKTPVIIGGFKLNTGVGDFVLQGLVFDGSNKTMGDFIQVASALETSRIIVRGCEVKGYNKGVIYGNKEGTIGSASFSGLLVHDMGDAQSIFDFRKKVYGSIIVENSTIYNGGARSIVRCDEGVGESLCVRNNTISNTGIGAGDGLLRVNVNIGDQYVVENNLFLNETGTTTNLAKSGTQKAVFRNNHYFNLGEDFWNGAYTLEEGTANGGSVLDADPCTSSANAQFKLTNQELKKAGVGDPRWR